MQFGRGLERTIVHGRKQVVERPYRSLFVAIIAVAGIGIGVVLASVAQQREEYVSRCVANKHVPADCHCTYDARVDMPERYRPVADAWAHGTKSDLMKAKADFHVSEFGRALMNQLAAVVEDPKTDTRTAKDLWSSLSSAGRRVTTVFKKALGPATKVEVVYDTVAQWMSARKAYGKHCRGVTDRLIGAADDAKKAVVNAAKDVRVESVRKAETIVTTVKSVATKLKDKVTGWWK